MTGLFAKIQAKIELYRLEQRYTRSRKQRTTFVSNATYVDGEYIYNTPNTTGSSNKSSSTASYAHESYGRRSLDMHKTPMYTEEEPTPAQKKRINRRFSAMPGFGSLSTKKSGQDWRPDVVDVRELR